jgi:hypothetical protein
MPDPFLGRYASVKLAAALVENLGSWKISLTGAEIDVSAFGDTWEKKMPGMKGWNASIVGMFDPADSDGQAILQAAYLAGTKIQNIRFYIDSTSYWTVASDESTAYGCYISSMDISHDKAGVAQITMNVLGFGKIKLI